MDRPERQSFNDGICTIYEVKNTAQAGNLPQERLVFRVGPLRYEERTVGVTRHYQAMQHAEEITMVIRVPRMDCISALDVCADKNGAQYEIRQVQHPRDVTPPVCDLALERVEADYEFA